MRRGGGGPYTTAAVAAAMAVAAAAASATVTGGAAAASRGGDEDPAGLLTAEDLGISATLRCAECGDLSRHCLCGALRRIAERAAGRPMAMLLDEEDVFGV